MLPYHSDEFGHEKIGEWWGRYTNICLYLHHHNEQSGHDRLGISVGYDSKNELMSNF